MMSSKFDRDWDALNALADGALGRDEARVLQGRIDSDPALAAEYDRILTLKSSLRRLRPNPQGQEQGRDRVERRLSAKRLMPLAASIALAFCVAFVLAAVLFERSREESVADLHRTFSEQTYILTDSGGLTLSSGTGFWVFERPDLTASNLTLVDVMTFRGDAGERIAMHYRGRRGCRVTLVADSLSMPGAGSTSGSGPAESDLAEIQLVYRWSTSKTRFVLLSEGMDRQRFAAIGAFAEAASRLSDEQEERRLALVDSTEKARPCA